MLKKLLQLSSANSVSSAATTPRHHVWIRYVATAFGLFVVLVGAANVMTTLAHNTLGNNVSLDIFAPAISLVNPSALTSVRGPSITHGVASTSATTTALTPARLVINSIGVNAAVEQVGMKADGSMGTPQKFGNVGWFALGAKPGAPGNAVIDGHVNNALTTAGVFEHLSQIKVGDTITVQDSSGNTLNFTVTKTQTITDASAQDPAIFATSGPSGLVLITCQGDWVPSAHSYSERLVVFASLGK